MIIIILANSIIVLPDIQAKDLGVVFDPLPFPCPPFFNPIVDAADSTPPNSSISPCFLATALAEVTTIISFLDYLLQ